MDIDARIAVYTCIPTGTYTNTHTHTHKRKHTHMKRHVLTWLRKYFPFFCNSNLKISVMKKALRLCCTGCGRRVSTDRSFLCRICFGKQAVLSGSRSSGNKCTICPGNTDNSGNSSAKGALGNAGNRVRKKGKKIAGRAGAFNVAFHKESLERVLRFRAERNRLHTELARLSSKRNGLRADLACLRQQQTDAMERLSQRFKTVRGSFPQYLLSRLVSGT